MEIFFAITTLSKMWDVSYPISGHEFEAPRISRKSAREALHTGRLYLPPFPGGTHFF